MAEWRRNTPWRQGQVLQSETAASLGLIAPEQLEGKVAIVVSHDCDIAQMPDAEPWVEVIVGNRLESVNGTYTHAKNARRLHLPFVAGSEQLNADLIAGDKQRIAKENLADHAPREAVGLAPADRSTLQRWLAARYRRSAFPDEFDRRLDETGLRDRLSKITKAHGASITAIFFEVDAGKDVVRSSQNDPYELSIYLVYSTEADPDAAEQAAQVAGALIQKAFFEKCFSGASQSWINIELIDCEVLADRAMTIHAANQLRRWSMDHFSLRAGPAHAILRDD